MTSPFVPSNNPLDIVKRYPVGMIFAERNPSTTDNSFSVGTEWQNTTTGDFFKNLGNSFNQSTNTTDAKWDLFATNSHTEIDRINGNSGFVVATAGAVNILGSGRLTTSGSASTLTLSITENEVLQINGNSGSAIPSAGMINIIGDGSLSTSGTGSTLTASLTGLTNHSLLVGAGTSTITKLATGVATTPLLSGGASADPVFSNCVFIVDAQSTLNIVSPGDGFLASLIVRNTDLSSPTASSRILLRTENDGGDDFIAIDPGQGDGPGGQQIQFGYQNVTGFFVININSTIASFPNNITGTTAFYVEAVTGNIGLGVDNTNILSFFNASQTTVGAAGGASPLPVTPLGYMKVNVNGVAVVIPYYLPS